MRNPAKFLTVFLSILLSGGLSLAAQTSPTASANSAASKDTASNSAKEELYPEKAYLSPSRYTNQYFDFSFDLPAEAQLQPLAEPGARDGSIQLLELGGPPPTDAEVAISAIPTAGSGNKQDAKAYMRYALDQELYRGVEELRGLSKASIAGHQFFLFETRRGIEQHVVLATLLGDYILRVVLAAHDEKMVHKLETSFDRVLFFAPPELKQVAGDARAYDGPSVSTHELDTLETDPPANHIDPGAIRGDFYENPTIGFSYRIPQGWVLEANGAVQPAVERYRERQDFGRPRVGRIEHRLMDACSRTLFSVWAKRPDASNQISYDDFGEVTVSAISLACFPRMKFPADASDQRTARDFLAQFGLTHPIMEDMRDAKVFTAGGSLFLFLHGTVGFEIPNDALARRLSIGMAITERRGYLLTWFFAAPHDQELQALSNERVLFDNAPPVKVINAAKSGPGPTSASAVTSHGPAGADGTSSSESPSSAANSSTSSSGDAMPGAASTSRDEGAAPDASQAETAGATASASASSQGSASGAGDSASSNSSGKASSGDTASGAASTSGADPAAAADQGPGDHPSLLRPGETVQPSKGTPIQKKNQSQ